MLPNGFLGTRADLLMDIVVVGIILTPVLMAYSFRLARRGRIVEHRRFQTVLLLVLLAVVAIFELDIRLSGGSKAFLKGSPFAGSGHLTALLNIHILIAISTFGGWAWLVGASRKRFAVELPGAFSTTHRKVGKLIFGGCILTAVTGLWLYYLGFVA